MHAHSLHKTYNDFEGMNNASQTCKDDSGLLEILASEEKKNGKLISRQNLSN